MLALATGWTPDTIGAVPLAFRRAAHWALYVRAVVPAGFPATDAPDGSPPEVRLAFAKVAMTANRLRADLFPEDP